MRGITGIGSMDESCPHFAGKKEKVVNKLFQLGAALLLSVFLLCSLGCSSKPTTPVKANRKVIGLVMALDPKLGYYTSKKDPLKSIEGLRQDQIACFGPELTGNIQAFYAAAGIHRDYANAVQVIGPTEALFQMKGAPRLYLINKNFEPRLQGAIRVRFTD
jgi:hypothetical protein